MDSFGPEPGAQETSVHVSQEQLAQAAEILKQIDFSETPTEVENRRNAPRVKFRAALTVIPLDSFDRAPIRIFTRNLSAAGIGFVSRRYFNAGQRIVISLKTNGTDGKLLLARVAFGRYLRKAFYDMGAEFLEAVKDPGGLGQIPNQWLYGANTAETKDETESGEGDGEEGGSDAAESPPAPPKASRSGAKEQ